MPSLDSHLLKIAQQSAQQFVRMNKVALHAGKLFCLQVTLDTQIIKMKTFKTIALLVLLALPMMVSAGNNDAGLIVGAEAEKKLNKKLSLAIEAEFRSRNDFRTADRISLGLNGSYKITKWLKAELGYQLLIDNNHEKISYNAPTIDDDGNKVVNYNNWRPSYWGTRHRFYALLTGSYKLNRVEFSLREGWRYTYRPEHTTKRYDFDNAMWEDKVINTKHYHVLRSRFKVEWDIPKWKFDPWASIELFNNLSLDKIRYAAGIDYTIKKKHAFSLFYRYQQVYDKDEEEGNIHNIGLSYKFKF